MNSVLETKQISRKRPYLLVLNALLLYFLWAVLYISFLILGAESNVYALLFAVLWSLPMLAIQLIVMHEGSHGAASDRRVLNTLLTGSISFLGGSSLLWIKQHCQAHHSFTNVHGYDHDVNTNGLLRLHTSQKIEDHHKYQHIYAWLLYPLFILSWIWWGDFRDLINNTYSMTRKELKLALIETVFVKIWHIAVFLVLPAFFLKSVALALACYVISFSILGLLMVVIFQLAHITNIQSLPATPGELGSDWALRQLFTTANFATENTFITWFIGGLNYQIEHHIFPTISHVNYPEVSKVVKKYCREKNLPYYSFPTVRSALVAHQQHLRRLGHA